MKGTSVGETSPTVRYGANTLDDVGDDRCDGGLETPLANFCRLAMRPSAMSMAIFLKERWG